ncbi:hypothetical protein RJT34_28898 [Clitoria ternatea]|uniref:Uncharacterized protein n=1 Tax=Clitoria ternatea TaxID=43366 RepID=A0AAN9FBJ6_CLITE
MATLVRNTTFSRTHKHRYSPLTLTSPTSTARDRILNSISYRTKRAKQRKIFLTTYKLSSIDSFAAAQPKSPKLHKVAFKLKKIVATVFNFMRTSGSFRSNSSISRDLI